MHVEGYEQEQAHTHTHPHELDLFGSSRRISVWRLINHHWKAWIFYFL
jgi:hypothetical protein